MEAVMEKRRGSAAGQRKDEVVAATVRMKKRSRTKGASANARGKRNQELGRSGEDAAVRYLARRGYEIVERNWTCFAGEADIIARDGDVLVFIEVKTRSDLSMGFPSEAVTKDKRERYEKIACAYVADHELNEMLLRFDVMGILIVDDERMMVRHHINAFSAESLS